VTGSAGREHARRVFRFHAHQRRPGRTIPAAVVRDARGGERTDAAEAAVRLARSFGSGEEGLRASQSARNLLAAGLESDIAFCARESVLTVVPRVVGLRGPAVELRVASGTEGDPHGIS